MALVHLLYRCPRCGADAMEGGGDHARCTSCATSFRRDRYGDDLAVGGGPGAHREPVSALADGVRSRPARDESEEGDTSLTSAARFHGALVEEPVRRRGRTLGFFERPGPGVPGFLRLTGDALSFRPVRAGAETVWALEQMTALQVASRSIQIGVRRTGTVQLSFPRASTLRWERALQERLRWVWRSRGRGEILEFQPRIVTR